MTADTDQQRVEAVLLRAAEALGDPVELIFAAFYARFPAARAAFERLSAGHPVRRLEGEMVEQLLYCLTSWFDRRREIELLLLESVPHHADILDVGPDWYAGLIEATCAVLAAPIPPGVGAERAALAGVEAALCELVRQGRAECRTAA